jgi:type VI secretion system protein ImpL
MSFVLSILKQRLVIELVGLTALCALIWFVGPLIAFARWTPLESEFNRLLVILILVLVWALYHLFVQARATKKNQKLMTELAIPTISPERAALDEAQSEEIAGLRRKFEEALQLLKTTQSRGKRDSHYLYELPWYVIIGGPGSGKTTLLLNSGLKFPLSERLGNQPVKGVGGTRNCDWFFADEAVFLDTAGRYTTQDSYRPVDKAAWGSFLELCKKHRPRRPINGVLLTMSMSELVELSEEKQHERARELRQRIMELYNVLGNRFPIYMIFTKCDLIAGFNDLFADLTQEERTQVWGETFPHESEKQLEKLLTRFEGDFDEVLRRLNHWTLRRIQEERDTNRRGSIFCFPQQLALLKPTILAFIHDIFGTSRFEMEPLLRGAYFTSGTQEGTPIDRVMGVLAGVYGMDRQELPAFRGRPTSFFITRLLKEVIFPEAELAGVDSRLEHRRSQLRWAAYAALALLTVGMITMWTVSYFSNRHAIAQVEEKIHDYRKISGQTETAETATRTMIARLNALVAARNVYKDRSWEMGFGLYQGDKIRTGINDVYEQRLMIDLLPEINRRLKGQIYEVMQRGDGADSALLYQLLRTYLMLANPEKMNTGQAGATIRQGWERDYSREPQLKEQLCDHSDSLLKLVYKPIPIDQTLVENARRKLKAVPIGTQLYAHLKSVALADHSNDFRLVDAVPRLSSEVFITADGQGFESLTIPGLYTRHGYDTFFKKKGLDLVQQALDESWVLNQQADQSRNLAPLYDDLQKQYFAEYEILWRKLLFNLKIKKPQGIYETIRILDHLSGPDTPLRPLLQAVEKNTSLTEAESGDSLEGKAKPSGSAEKGSPLGAQGGQSEVSSSPARKLESSFQPLNRLVQSKGQSPPPIEDVLRSINEVRDVLMQITSGASSEEQALKFAKERMHGFGARDAIKKAGFEFARLPEPLQEWLKSVTTSGWEITLESARSELNGIWRTEVVAHYTTSLKGRYPLFRDSRNDATMADFSRFFGPKGILDRFFETHLKAFVDTSGPDWRQVSMDNLGIRLSGELLNQLQSAAKIRNAFFASGEANPSVQFQLKPIALDSNVAGFRINIDGQTEEYAHGPALASKFQWPGPHPNLGVILTFATLDGKVVSKVEEGAWAWLKTLDKATIERTSLQEVFRITFQIDGYKARYELRADSVYNPFNLSELQQFRCPESL